MDTKLDLEPIEKRLANATYRTDLLVFTDPTFIRNAPVDIAALIAEVKRLREEIADYDQIYKAMDYPH